MNSRNTAQHQYSTAGQVFESEPTGEEIQPEEILSDTEKTVLTATQSPTAGAALSAPITTAAWRNKPCWFVIAANNRVIAPRSRRRSLSR